VLERQLQHQVAVAVLGVLIGERPALRAEQREIDHVHDRAFACAVLADDRDAPGREVEVELVERPVVARANRERIHAETSVR
jgi:hypothetical protein